MPPCRKNVTESPSFSGGDNPHVLYSPEFRISGAPDKYEVRGLYHCGSQLAWEGQDGKVAKGEGGTKGRPDSWVFVGLDWGWSLGRRLLAEVMEEG